jgi:hypothetical protein
MTAPVITAVENGQIDPELVVDKEMAAILLGVGSTRIYDLQREDKLPAELTVQSLVDYEETKGTFGTTRTTDGTKRYDVWLTAEAAAALEGEGVKVRDPRKAEQERKEKAEADARKRLADAGLSLSV